MNRLVIGVAAVGLALGGACGKKKEAAKEAPQPGEPAKAGAPAAAGDTAGPAAAPWTDTSSKLWAFAPPDAAFGFVVGDGVGARVLGDVSGPLRQLFAHPAAGEARRDFDALKAELGFDPLDPAGWKTIGVDLAQGVAFFIGPTGEKSGVLVLPVVDRAAFRTKVKGTVEKVGDREVDKIEELMCVTGGDRYVCATSLELVDAALKAQGSAPLAAAVKGLPQAERGDVELYVDLTKIPEAKDELAELAPLGTPKQAGASARLASGSVTLRGWARGDFGGPIAKALQAAPPPAFAANVKGATSVTRFRMDPSLALAEAPPQMPLGGVDLRTELVDQLTGELQGVTAGKGLVAGAITLGIKDPARVGKAVQSICATIKTAATNMPFLENVALTESSCSGEVAIAKADPKLAQMPSIKWSLAVKDQTLVSTVGDVDLAALAGGSPAADAVSPVAREALGGPTTFATWTTGFDFDLTQLPADLMAKMRQEGGQEFAAGLEVFRTLSATIYEVAFAGAVMPDKVSAVLQVTTFGSDPAEARAAYAAALAKRDAGDKAGYDAALAEIESKWPGSLVARRARLAKSGSPLLGPGAGMIAGGFGYMTVSRPVEEPPPEAFAPAKVDAVAPAPGGKKKKKE